MVLAAATLFAQEKPTTESSTQRVIFVLNNAPSNTVASALSQIFKSSSQATVNSSLIGNLVVLEAHPDELPEMIEMVQRLDRAPAMVTIEAIAIAYDRDSGIQLPDGSTEEVTRAVAELENKQRLRVVDRIQLTTLSDQSAFVQIGQTVPRNMGQKNNYTFSETGVLFRATPRAADDGSVALQFSFEKSTLEESKPSDDDDTPPMSGISCKVETTVRLEPNKCVVLGGLRDSPRGGSKQWRLIISAEAAPSQ
jgi:type II secretory pathway component GspD/PulD (secretin)